MPSLWKLAFAGLFLAHCRAQGSPQLSLNTCGNKRSQLFRFDQANSSWILAADAFCIDILAWGTTPGSEAYTAACHHEDRDPAHQNQEFSSLPTALPGALIKEAMSNLSLTPDAPFIVGSKLSLGAGSPFYFLADTPPNGFIVHVESSLCVDAGLPLLAGPPAVLRTCSAERSAWQLLDLSASVSGSGPVRLLTPDLQTNSSLCLAASNAQSTNALLEALPCAGVDEQTFSWDSQGVLRLVKNGAALDTALQGAGPAYLGLALELSSVASPQTWTISGSPSSGRLMHVPSNLCLDLGQLPWGHGCLDPAQKALPYCDPTQSVAARVEDLLARLTLPEKVALSGANTGSLPGTSSCDTIDPGVPRLSIPPKQWLVETNSMAASQCYGEVCATAWPSALNLAASGNSTLWHEKGRVVGDELRALNNLAWHRADGSVSYSGLNGFGPDINAMRDPRNGRQGELVADDPYLTAAYAVQMLQGMQNGPDSYYKATAGVKHYAGKPCLHPSFRLACTFTLPSLLRRVQYGNRAARLQGQFLPF
jgi:Glycosyl hydrolase family 3 N terminal domain